MFGALLLKRISIPRLSASLLPLPAACPLARRNAATVVMLDSKKQPHPVKPHLSLREENDVITHVVNIEFSTWERGLDERRLSCVIDDAGVVGSMLPVLPCAAGRLPLAY